MRWRATKDEKKQARRKIAKADARIKTYSVIITLECGHTLLMAMTARKVNQGVMKNLPRTTECWECLQAIMAANTEENERNNKDKQEEEQMAREINIRRCRECGRGLPNNLICVECGTKHSTIEEKS